MVRKYLRKFFGKNLKQDFLNKNLIDFFLVDPTFQCGKYFTCFIDGRPKNLTIGKNVSFRSYCNVLLFDKSVLIIQDNVFLNNYCSINCLEKITIGENTIIGEGVHIYDHNHKYATNGNLKVERNEYMTSEVRIGNNCWIGSNVTILKGVSIGDNVIIGANCLIYKSIDANTIVKHSENLILNPRGVHE